MKRIRRIYYKNEHPDFLVAIDPGTERSAMVILDVRSKQLEDSALLKNIEVRTWLRNLPVKERGHLAIEMIASYGMPVGANTFETCVWIGRFLEVWGDYDNTRLFRTEIRQCICHSGRAKDANIRQALIDRYGGSKEKAIGKKAIPGPLYGFKADMWQALAVGLTCIELKKLC